MEKQTKEILTGAGVKIVIVDQLTGRDAMDIETAIMGKSMEFDAQTKTARMDPSEIYRRNLRALSDFVVVSVDGETDNEKKWEMLLSLPVVDWKMIQAELSSKAEGILSQTKK